MCEVGGKRQPKEKFISWSRITHYNIRTPTLQFGARDSREIVGQTATTTNDAQAQTATGLRDQIDGRSRWLTSRILDGYPLDSGDHYRLWFGLHFTWQRDRGRCPQVS